MSINRIIPQRATLVVFPVEEMRPAVTRLLIIDLPVYNGPKVAIMAIIDVYCVISQLRPVGQGPVRAQTQINVNKHGYGQYGPFPHRP